MYPTIFMLICVSSYHLTLQATSPPLATSYGGAANFDDLLQNVLSSNFCAPIQHGDTRYTVQPLQGHIHGHFLDYAGITI